MHPVRRWLRPPLRPRGISRLITTARKCWCKVAETHGVDEATRAPFFAAADGLSSDYDHGRVLTALINRSEGQLTPAVATAVIASARRLGSDYERANVLVAVARHLRLSGELRRAFVDAANGIGSEYDRNRALAALEGSAQLD